MAVFCMWLLIDVYRVYLKEDNLKEDMIILTHMKLYNLQPFLQWFLQIK